MANNNASSNSLRSAMQDSRQYSSSTNRDEHIQQCMLPDGDKRDIRLLVTSNENNPVIAVNARLIMEDGSTFNATSNQQGVAIFTNVPQGVTGKITYQDEEDLLAKCFAADFYAVIGQNNINIALQLLQSAVDFRAITSAYRNNYSGELGAAVKAAFVAADQLDVIEYLLLKTGLLQDSNVTIYGHGDGK